MGDSQELLQQQIKEQGELVRKLKAAKESSEKDRVSNKDREQCDLNELDKHFLHYSYICGYTPSNCDVILAKKLEHYDLINHKYITRWWNHMRSFSVPEISEFPNLQPPDVMNHRPKGKTISIEAQVCV